MHELGLAAALVAQVDQIAQREGATRVVRIELAVGDLSGVDRDALEFVFPIAAGQSTAEGAVLATRVVSGRDLLIVAMEVE
jgi:hydrogenase nickel incorporation protein HypA/HybF